MRHGTALSSWLCPCIKRRGWWIRLLRAQRQCFLQGLFQAHLLMILQVIQLQSVEHVLQCKAVPCPQLNMQDPVCTAAANLQLSQHHSLLLLGPTHVNTTGASLTFRHTEYTNPGLQCVRAPPTGHKDSAYSLRTVHAHVHKQQGGRMSTLWHRQHLERRGCSNSSYEMSVKEPE